MSNRWTKADINKLGLKVTDQSRKTEQLPKKGKFAKNPKSRELNPKIGANMLTKHMLRVLDLKGFHVWRQNNGGVYDPTKKCFRANSTTLGISDIIGFNRKTGQFIACEIKAGKDKLSKEQELFLKWVGDSGGVSLVVRTMNDIENMLNSEKWKKS